MDTKLATRGKIKVDVREAKEGTCFDSTVDKSNLYVFSSSTRHLVSEIGVKLSTNKCDVHRS